MDQFGQPERLKEQAYLCRSVCNFQHKEGEKTAVTGVSSYDRCVQSLGEILIQAHQQLEVGRASAILHLGTFYSFLLNLSNCTNIYGRLIIHSKCIGYVSKEHNQEHMFKNKKKIYYKRHRGLILYTVHTIIYISYQLVCIKGSTAFQGMFVLNKS